MIETLRKMDSGISMSVNCIYSCAYFVYDKESEA